MPDRSLGSSAALNQQAPNCKEGKSSNKENLNDQSPFNSAKTLAVGYCTRNVSTTAALNG